MRTAAVQDGIWMRTKCLVHTDCRAAGKMLFPSGRTVHLKTKTGDIKDLNANFVSHLEKCDKVEGTSHADTWRKGLIHGGRARPSRCRTNQPTDGGGETDAEDAPSTDPPGVILRSGVHHLSPARSRRYGVLDTGRKCPPRPGTPYWGRQDF